MAAVLFPDRVRPLFPRRNRGTSPLTYGDAVREVAQGNRVDGPATVGRRHEPSALPAGEQPRSRGPARAPPPPRADQDQVFLCHAPSRVKPARLVHLTGPCWAIETCFQEGKL